VQLTSMEAASRGAAASEEGQLCGGESYQFVFGGLNYKIGAEVARFREMFW
jgi:hypothetical protein